MLLISTFVELRVDLLVFHAYIKEMQVKEAKFPVKESLRQR
jgi:hypothetical protein